MTEIKPKITKRLLASPEKTQAATKPIQDGIDHLIFDPIAHTTHLLNIDRLRLPEQHPVMIVLGEIAELTEQLYTKSIHLTELQRKISAKEKMGKLRGLVRPEHRKKMRLKNLSQQLRGGDSDE